MYSDNQNHDCSTDSEDYGASREIKYVLIGCKGYDMLLVPKKALLEVCDISEDSKYVTFKEDYEWPPMSGGEDTWMQSYAVLHGRGWGITGQFNKSIIVTGIYYLKYD